MKYYQTPLLFHQKFPFVSDYLIFQSIYYLGSWLEKKKDNFFSHHPMNLNQTDKKSYQISLF